MFWDIIDAVLRPFVGFWVRAFFRSADSVARATDEPQVHSAGIDPDRILLVGNGITMGYGVLSHEIGLPGQLARRLGALTDRGVDVDIVAKPRMFAADCRATLAEYELGRFDALVLTIGGSEVTSLSSLSTWRRNLGELLDFIDSSSPDSLRVFVVGLAKTKPGAGFPRIFVDAFNRHIASINRITLQESATHPRVRVITTPPSLDAGVEIYTRQTYEGWAAVLAPTIAEAFDTAGVVIRPDVLTDEVHRQGALHDLHILDTPPEERFDRFTSLAIDLFGVGGAAITFIDHSRQWVKSSVGWLSKERPREDAVCNVTIQQPRLLLIEDARLDDRINQFTGVVAENGLRFYAGYPLEAPNGERIGSFCITDNKPRTLSRPEQAVLRDLALRVQAEIWDQAELS